MIVLEDLVEIDSFILDLEGRDYVLSVNAYEKLKRKCSQNLEHLRTCRIFSRFCRALQYIKGMSFHVCSMYSLYWSPKEATSIFSSEVMR